MREWRRDMGVEVLGESHERGVARWGGEDTLAGAWVGV